jgi:hypothetical protein
MGHSAGRGHWLTGHGARPYVPVYSVHLKKLKQLCAEGVGIVYAVSLQSHRAGGETMARILATLIAATFVAVALLAWVTVPTRSHGVSPSGW